MSLGTSLGTSLLGGSVIVGVVTGVGSGVGAGVGSGVRIVIGAGVRTGIGLDVTPFPPSPLPLLLELPCFAGEKVGNCRHVDNRLGAAETRNTAEMVKINLANMFNA